MSLNIKSIREIADPGFRFIFMDDEGYTQALLISGLEQNAFLVHHQAGKLPERERKGFFVASEGRGIVRFEGECKNTSTGLYQIHIDLNEMQLINRREFVRYHFNQSPPVLLNYENRQVPATLVNISEGGLRLSLEEKLPLNVIFKMELNLSILKEGLHFETDGLVIYSAPEDDPEVFITGVAFVAETFKNNKARLDYLAKREEIGLLIRKMGKS